MVSVVAPVVLLTGIYTLVIGTLVLLLRRLRVPNGWAVLLGFLVFGLATGLLAAWAWPYDSSVYPNFYATLLGDWLYGLSAEHVGAPWLLDLPQVYVVASLLLCGILGWLAQTVYRRRVTRERKSDLGRS